MCWQYYGENSAQKKRFAINVWKMSLPMLHEISDDHIFAISVNASVKAFSAQLQKLPCNNTEASPQELVQPAIEEYV